MIDESAACALDLSLISRIKPDVLFPMISLTCLTGLVPIASFRHYIRHVSQITTINNTTIFDFLKDRKPIK